MKTIMAYGNTISWFNPFPELSWFEPVKFQGLVEESVSETPFGYKIDYTLPGMKKKDLKMRVENNQFVIEGHHRESDNKLFGKKRKLFRASFYKAVPLAEDMDIDKVKAKFKGGVLSVTIPKKQEYVNYREIPVTGEDVPVEDVKIVGRESLRSMIQTAKEKIRSVFGKVA